MKQVTKYKLIEQLINWNKKIQKKDWSYIKWHKNERVNMNELKTHKNHTKSNKTIKKKVI